MRVKTKCRMGNLCAIRKGEGECEKNCYYNTRNVITNADRIRAMSDEELAEYLDGVCHDLWQMFVKDPQKMWLDWLRQEADHE